MWQVIQELNQCSMGWWNYFRLTEAKSFLKGRMMPWEGSSVMGSPIPIRL
ncbi:group II intron maturase-specific domain-containing protein [uncultured Desulfobacter sp.]|nr:group II intron maturase-specific domain-containing protein [uncultured Desulfobacter sp.]